MNVLKDITLILILFCFSLSYGQYDWRDGKIILKSGQTLNGLVKMSVPTTIINIFGSAKVHYRKQSKGKIKKIRIDDISKVFYGTNSHEIGYFEHVPFSKNKTRLLKLIIKGKTKLYTRSYIKQENNYNSVNQQGIMGGMRGSIVGNKKPEIINQYYVIRDGEDNVTYFPTLKFNEFKEIATSYFADCKKIIEYLEGDLYEGYEIKELIEDYNMLCE